jgi:hypothetical protein
MKIRDHIFAILSLTFCSLIILYGIDWAIKDIYLGAISNSDLIYIESIYKDLFVNKYPISGWLVSRAPYIFPDWILYFFLRFFLNSYPVAWYAYVFINLFFLIVTFYYLSKATVPSLTTQKRALFTLAWSCLFISILTQVPEGLGLHTFLLPVYHSGALINGLIIFFFWLYILNNKLTFKLSVLIFGFSAIATISDQWWIIWFGLPIGVLGLLLIFFKKYKQRQLFTFLVLMGAGVLAGELSSFLIAKYKLMYFSQVPIGNPHFTYYKQLSLIFTDLLDLFSSSFVITSLFVLTIFSALRSFKFFLNDKKNEEQNLFKFNLNFIAIFSVLIPLVVIFSLRLWEKWNYRYLIPLFYFSWLIPGLTILKFLSTKRKYIYLTLFIPSFLFLQLAAQKKKSDYEAFQLVLQRHDQGFVCIDLVSKIHNLRHGASEYWLAKQVTEISNVGIRLNQFTYLFEPLHWMNNLNWYFQKDKKDQFVDYDFFISSHSDESVKKILTTFGMPTDINVCAKFIFFIYKDDKKLLFNQILHEKSKSFFDSKNIPYALASPLSQEVVVDNEQVRNFVNLKQLLAKADQYHLEKNFFEEFKTLKLAELTLTESVKTLGNFSDHVKNWESKDNALKAELLWKLSRIYYYFYLQSNQPRKMDLLYDSYNFADQADSLSSSRDSAKWKMLAYFKLIFYDSNLRRTNRDQEYLNYLEKNFSEDPAYSEVVALIGYEYLKRINKEDFLESKKENRSKAMHMFSTALRYRSENKIFESVLTKLKDHQDKDSKIQLEEKEVEFLEKMTFVL